MPEADLVILNARILTMGAPVPGATALAVAGERILAIGTDREIRPLAVPEARVIDGRRGTLMPGFVESHMHLFAGAAELDHLQLAGASGFAALAAAVRTHADRNPQAPVVMAQGADYAILDGVAPTRHDLDRILPDRPLALTAPDHHTMWANTAALTAAGLMAGRALPPGNEVVMAADGTATGELREVLAFQPLIDLSGEARARLGLAKSGPQEPDAGPVERAADRAILRRGLAHAAAHGITSIQNMDGNFYTLELLAELRVERALTVRVQVPMHFTPEMEIAELEKARAMTAAYADDWLSSGAVKIFYDGVLDGWTAVMLADYSDRPGWRGEPLFPPERLAELATAADRRGLQIAVHAIGDGAVRATLDAFAAARAANGPRDSRHRIEHLEVIDPADIPRFAALGVIASFQPPHPPGAMGLPLEPTLGRIGRARWPFAYAWAALAQEGAPIAFSSDWPVSDICPVKGIAAALMREPWVPGLPDQRLDRLATLAAYTTGGAYAGFAEARRGRLAPGLDADIVLLTGDILACTPASIADLDVALTVCGGRITHEAPRDPQGRPPSRARPRCEVPPVATARSS